MADGFFFFRPVLSSSSPPPPPSSPPSPPLGGTRDKEKRTTFKPIHINKKKRHIKKESERNGNKIYFSCRCLLRLRFEHFILNIFFLKKKKLKSRKEKITTGTIYGRRLLFPLLHGPRFKRDIHISLYFAPPTPPDLHPLPHPPFVR